MLEEQHFRNGPHAGFLFLLLISFMVSADALDYYYSFLVLCSVAELLQGSVLSVI